MKAITFLFSAFIMMNVLACGNAPQAASDQEGQIIKDVNAQELHDILAEQGGQVLDVRTEGELVSGVIPGAIHMDFYSNSFQQELEKLDKDKPVYVYCAAGGRSGKAMSMMKSMNFKEVYNLSGGFPTWQAAGFEVQKN